MSTAAFQFILYAIKHIPTGYYMPEPTGRMGRGSSH